MKVSSKPLSATSLQALYLIYGFLVLSATVRLFATPHAVWIDEAEQVYHSQWLQPGAYDAQPPLYTWIHHLVFALTEPNLYFVILFKFAIVITTFWCVKKIFSLTCGDDTPATILGLLSMIFIFQFWDASLLSTNTLLVTWASVWSVYLVIIIARDPRWLHYLLLGLTLGIGFLSKYNFVLAIGALAIAGMGIQTIWRAMVSPRILVTLISFFVVTSPHVMWFLQNSLQVESTLQSELGDKGQLEITRSVFYGAVSFVSKLMAFIGIWVLAMVIFFRKAIFKSRQRDPDIWLQFFGSYILSVTLLIMLSALIFEIRVFHERYFQPFYIFIPVYAFLLFGHQISLSTTNSIWFQRLSVVVFIGIFCFNSLPFIIDPLMGKSGYMNIPYDRIAHWVDQEKEDGDLIITNHILFAGNIKLNLEGQQKVVVWNDHEHFQTETSDSSIQSLLIIWHDKGDGVAEMIASFKNLDPDFDNRSIQYKEIPYHKPKGKHIRIGMVRLARSTK